MAMAKGLGLTTVTGYILVDTTLKCGITNTYICNVVCMTSILKNQVHVIPLSPTVYLVCVKAIDVGALWRQLEKV